MPVIFISLNRNYFVQRVYKIKIFRGIYSILRLRSFDFFELSKIYYVSKLPKVNKVNKILNLIALLN